MPAFQLMRLFLLGTVGFSKLHHHAAELTGVSAPVLKNVVTVCAYGNLGPNLHIASSLFCFVHPCPAEVDHALAGIDLEPADVRILL